MPSRPRALLLQTASHILAATPGAIMTRKFEGRNVLVTGGAGFIGSNLAARLVAEGANVTVLDSMLPDYGGNLFNLDPIRDRITLNFSDMRDRYSLEYLVKEKDYIFNLAGQVSHLDSMTDPERDLDINVNAQLVFLETCRKHNPEVTIVHASTRQVYGRPHYLPVDEAHPIQPPDINGIHKLASESYHSLFHRVYGLRAVSLRLTNTYGPRQLIRNARLGFVGWFLNRVLSGQPIQLFGGGGQLRDFNFVDDAVDAMVLAAENEPCYGNTYNLGGERSSLEDLAALMIGIQGAGEVEKVPFPEDLAKIDIGDYYASHALFSEATGWSPAVSLEAGMRRTLAYFNSYKSHYLDKSGEGSVS